MKGEFVVVHDWYQLSFSFKRMTMRLNVIIFEKDSPANSLLSDERILSNLGRCGDIGIPDPIDRGFVTTRKSCYSSVHDSDTLKAAHQESTQRLMMMQ